MKRFRQRLHINFACPEISKLKDKKGEYYNPRNQTCYIFDMLGESDVEMSDHLIQCINHAELHYIIQVLEGTSKSRKFDSAARPIRKWDKTVYSDLF